jgi:hypothetical protein
MLGELSSSDPGPYKTPVYEVGEAAAHTVSKSTSHEVGGLNSGPTEAVRSRVKDVADEAQQR